VNTEKSVLHFIVDRTIDGVIPLADLATQFKVGDAIAVQLSKYSTKNGPTYRVLHAEATDEMPSAQVRKQFNDEVRVSNGMGFTLGDVFIPPPLVAEHHIRDGQSVSGVAVLNFNRRRQNWGWKAISLVLEGAALPTSW
jgi:hypothetical protein